jgi:diamine N-acetyltransferase
MISIVRANEYDGDYIGKVRESVNDYMLSNYVYSKLVQEVWWANVMKRDDMFVYIIVNNSTCVGYAIIDRIDVDNSRCYAQVQIEEQHRGNGYGSGAWDRILRACFETMKMNKVVLEVITTNLRAIHVYDKLGFKIEGTLKNHYKKIDRFIDVHIMSILRADYYKNERMYL